MEENMVFTERTQLGLWNQQGCEEPEPTMPRKATFSREALGCHGNSSGDSAFQTTGIRAVGAFRATARPWIRQSQPSLFGATDRPAPAQAPAELRYCYVVPAYIA